MANTVWCAYVYLKPKSYEKFIKSPSIQKIFKNLVKGMNKVLGKHSYMAFFLMKSFIRFYLNEWNKKNPNETK